MSALGPQKKSNWLSSAFEQLTALCGAETLAALLMLVGTVIFPASFIYANQNNLTPYETGLARGIVVTLVTWWMLRTLGCTLELSHWNLKYLIVRNTVMIFQVMVFAESQFYLPLPLVSILHSTTPLFVYILDYYVYGIKMNEKQIVGGVLSFIGVVLIINGHNLTLYFDPAYEEKTDFKNYRSDDPFVLSLVGIIIIVTCFVQSYAIILTKKLINVNALQINYYQGIQIIMSSAILMPIKEVGLPMDGFQFIKVIFFCAIPMVAGSLFFTTSLTLTKQFGVIITLQFVGVIFNYAVSILRYNETVNLVCLVGAVMVIAGVVRVLLCREGH